MANDEKYKVQAGFFNSIEEDRMYSADDMNRPYTKLISNGIFATPQGEASDYLQVFTAENGMNIIVSSGYALIGDKWFENPSDLIITISQNSEILTRIDSIIAQVDKTQAGREGSIVYRQGTASSNPVHPEINTDEDIFEFRLADIIISPSCVEITQDLITDCRGSAECPWITSLIKQVDTSTLYAQWQSAYQQYYNDQIREHDAFFEKSTTDFTNFKNEQEQAYNKWFENIKNNLDGDTAGKILQLIENNTQSINKNTQNIDELKKTSTPRHLTKTIQVEDWKKNGERFEYEIIDEKVTEEHLVQCFLAVEEQEKITGRASTKSENGKYTLIFTEKPEEAITMDIVITRTESDNF